MPERVKTEQCLWTKIHFTESVLLVKVPERGHQSVGDHLNQQVSCRTGACLIPAAGPTGTLNNRGSAFVNLNVSFGTINVNRTSFEFCVKCNSDLYIYIHWVCFKIFVCRCLL